MPIDLELLEKIERPGSRKPRKPRPSRNCRRLPAVRGKGGASNARSARGAAEFRGGAPFDGRDESASCLNPPPEPLFLAGFWLCSKMALGS